MCLDVGLGPNLKGAAEGRFLELSEALGIHASDDWPIALITVSSNNDVCSSSVALKIACLLASFSSAMTEAAHVHRCAPQIICDVIAIIAPGLSKWTRSRLPLVAKPFARIACGTDLLR